MHTGMCETKHVGGMEAVASVRVTVTKTRQAGCLKHRQQSSTVTTARLPRGSERASSSPVNGMRPDRIFMATTPQKVLTPTGTAIRKDRVPTCNQRSLLRWLLRQAKVYSGPIVHEGGR